jgi:MFS family permease
MSTPRESAIVVAFVANGLGGPSFLARLPDRQSDLGLSDAALGLTLVGMAAGAMVVSPLAGRLVGVFGSRRVVVTATVALGASLWTAGAAPSAGALFTALAFVGAADAAMDIGMNANGAAYEDRTGRSVMHGFHGAWSLGALGGAGLAALAAVAGVSLTVQLAMVGAAIAAAVLATRSGLVADDALPATARGASASPRVGNGHARTPKRQGVVERVRAPIVVLAAATVAGAVVEGGASDWSAIQLERLGVATGVSALGYAAFMAGMVGGRFAGDRLTDRFGGPALLRGGMAMVAAGLLVGVSSANPVAFAVGLFFAGLGAAGFFPLAFSAAARTPGVAPGSGAATVSLAARVGFLVEPVIVGAVADLFGLRWAFVLVAGTAVALAAAAPLVIPAGSRAAAVAVSDVREA